MQKFTGIPVGNFMMANSREFPNGIPGGLAVQAAIEARCRWWLMARVSGHVKSHTKHLPCDHATVSNHLDACHHSATYTTAAVWRESPLQ